MGRRRIGIEEAARAVRAGKRYVEVEPKHSPAVKKVTLPRVACLDGAEIDWAGKGWAQAGAKPSQPKPARAGLAAGRGVACEGSHTPAKKSRRV